MNDIQFFTDEDLLNIYQINAHQLSIARRKPHLYAEKIPQFMQDQKEIEQEIEGRVSIDFMHELDQVRHGYTAAGTIHPGNLYRHKVLPLLRLQVVDEHDYRGPLYSVRCFIGRSYACRFIVKASTLIEHFDLTTEI